jgi:hypothetical protein
MREIKKSFIDNQEVAEGRWNRGIGFIQMKRSYEKWCFQRSAWLAFIYFFSLCFILFNVIEEDGFSVAHG